MMGQNSFVKTAFVCSGALTLSLVTLSLIASASPAFAQTGLSEADSLDDTEVSIQILTEIETLSETPEIEDSIAENTVEVTATAPESTKEGTEETTEESIETAEEQTVISPAASEAAMSEFVRALSADLADAQAASAETLSETSTEVAIANPLVEAPEGLLEDEVAANTLVEELEELEKLEEVNRPAGAAAIGELASVGVDALAMDAFAVESDSVPALKAALNSGNKLTQLYAADALWTLTGDSNLVLPTLISAAASDNFQIRNLATSGLAYLGRRALPAVPALNRLLGENNSTTRTIAQATIDIIKSNNRPATTLGILARESRRLRIVPAAIRTIGRLWR